MKPRIATPEPELDAAFDHVLEYWPLLMRDGSTLAFPLAGRFIKPGGFFKWFFYWDSYFALLGMVVQGKWQLAREVVDGLLAEIEEFGLVPNYNSPNSVCSSRSQSPFLTSAIREVSPAIDDPTWIRRAISLAETEYEAYWAEEPHLTEIGLSRYIDTSTNGGCETVPDTPHFRAIGESGWDNTPRFGDDATQVVPVDLNCQLFRYELDLAEFWELLGEQDRARTWRNRANSRSALIDRYLWDDNTGFYWDYDLRTGDRLRNTPRSLASFVPLWASVASQEQAQRLVKHLPVFEFDYGLTSCEPGWEDGSEHNYPTGWPYAHWYVCCGLRNYGYHEDAIRIAMKWLRLVAAEFSGSGSIRERHNVVERGAEVPGRYPPQRGFAWTNGVYAALLVRLIFGVDSSLSKEASTLSQRFPIDWQGQRVEIDLPSYPWPNGIRFSSADAVEQSRPNSEREVRN